MLLLLLAMQLVSVSLEHELKLRLQMLRQLLLEEARNLLAMLTVPISNGEEMAELHAAEMRHRDPHVLVDLVRVARRDAGLGGKSKLGDTIGIHLLGVSRKVTEWSHLTLALFVLLRISLLFRLRALNAE